MASKLLQSLWSLHILPISIHPTLIEQQLCARFCIRCLEYRMNEAVFCICKFLCFHLSFYIEVNGRYQGWYPELHIKYFFHVSGDIFIAFGQQPNLDKVRRNFLFVFVWSVCFELSTGKISSGNHLYICKLQGQDLILNI